MSARKVREYQSSVDVVQAENKKGGHHSSLGLRPMMETSDDT